MKKIILSTVETILFAIIMIFCVFNVLSNTTAQFAVSSSGKLVLIGTFCVIITSYFIGLFSGLLYSFIIGEKYKEKIEFYIRKNDKLSVQSEIDSDSKEVLQRKIAVLETALNNALKNK